MKVSLMLSFLSFVIGLNAQSLLPFLSSSSESAGAGPLAASGSSQQWFIEYETWKVAPGNEAEHDEMIRQWFRYVRAHRQDMFPEWKAARYYRQTDRDGNPTGRFIMVFEYHSLDGHHAYKERRKDWSGPYADYKKVDPYELFEKETVTTEYWQPLEVDLWFEFDDPGKAND